MSTSVGDLFDKHSNEIENDIISLRRITDISHRNEKIQDIVKRELSFNQEIHHRSTSELQKVSSKENIWFHLVQKLLNLYEPAEQKTSTAISKALEVFGIRAPLYLSLSPYHLEQACEAQTTALIPGTISPVGAKTCNGVYFLTSPESGKKFIVKPIAQEEGMPGNPQGNTFLRQYGFTAGQGAMRERLAFNVHRRLGCDFGVPFTEVVEIEHPLLSQEYGIAQNIATLLKTHFKIDQELDLSQAIDPKAKSLSLDLLLELIIQYIKDEENNDRRFICEILKQHLKGGTVSKPALIIIARTYQIRASSEIVNFISQITTILKTPPSLIPLCSIQQFIPSKSYGHFTFEELSQISDEEMHKCILDIAFNNCDRHMNNILFNQKASNELGVVLIDHGLCFPSSKALQNGPRLEWTGYPQFKRPLTDPYASVFRHLDIDLFMIELRADQALFEVAYPENSRLSKESYSLLELNLHVIQQGVRAGSSVESIALFLQPNLQDDLGGEASTVYQTYLAERKQVDWKTVDQELKEILSTPIDKRTRK
jgi:hypothetical protein